MNYYDVLEEAVEEGDLNIYLILSPPRTGSTLLGSSISLNPKMDNYCHEPCFDLEYVKEDSDLVYKNISDHYSNVKDGEEPVNLVLKDMTHWAHINKEYKRLISLAEKPVMFLIRNPLIAVESKVRRFIMTCDMRDKEELNEYLKGMTAEEMGFSNWNDLLNNLSNGERKNIGLNEEVLESRPGEDTCSELHRFLLDSYASDRGFKNWRELVDNSFEERDYKDFSGILGREGIFSYFDLGWEALEEEVEYMESKNLSYLVIDSSELRLSPHQVMEEICDNWNMYYKEKMVEWGDRSLIEVSSQDKAYQTIWYETLSKSRRILDPSEIPVPLENFPGDLEDYINEKIMPVYFRTFFEMKRKDITPEKEVLVPLNNLAISRLKSLEELEKSGDYEISSPEELGDRFVPREEIKELVFDRDEQDSNGVRMKFKDVDPVFAAMNGPSLLENPNFLEKNQNYKDIFEHLIEWRRREKN